jgi:carboxymethylenebutenolidase
MPSDTKFVRISRTIGKDQVVDELILSFTHDIEISAMIPGISPTRKYVELPLIVVMKSKGNKNSSRTYLLGSSSTISSDRIIR